MTKGDNDLSKSACRGAKVGGSLFQRIQNIAQDRYSGLNEF